MHVVLNGWFLATERNAHTGTGQYLRALLEQLPRVAPQHTLTVVVPGPAVSVPPGVRVQAVPCGAGHLAKVWFEQRLFPQACRDLKADLAHVPYWAPPLAAPVPLVVTVHDLIPLLLPEYRGGPLVRAYTALAAAGTPGATLVLTDSEASRADLVQRLGLPEARVRRVYLAAGPQYTPQNDWRADEAVRARYGLPEAYVLYLGGFDVRKNVRALLSAWTWAAGSIGEAYPLVIAGALPQPDGRLFEDYPALAAQFGVADSVRFIGAVAEADKPAVYRGAAAFVYPSRYEGFGLPPLEAMACGVPVLTTAAGSIGEVVGEAAFLIDPEDTRKFGAGLITCVIEPSVADHLKARGLERARLFSWERTARETAAAYESVVSH